MGPVVCGNEGERRSKRGYSAALRVESSDSTMRAKKTLEELALCPRSEVSGFLC